MYKLMPLLTKLKFITLVISTLPIVAIPAEANPQSNSHPYISTPMSVAAPSPHSTGQLVAENQPPVRRYGKQKLALEIDINTHSGSAENALAQHLAKRGIKFYGAYWCPHCQRQKALFGQEALQYLPYIECAPGGQNSQRQLCKEKNIKLFPSWEIDGKVVTGTRSLKDLAEISGYEGPINFQNR
jgi:glutaredoxin